MNCITWTKNMISRKYTTSEIPKLTFAGSARTRHPRSNNNSISEVDGAASSGRSQSAAMVTTRQPSSSSSRTDSMQTIEDGVRASMDSTSKISMTEMRDETIEARAKRQDNRREGFVSEGIDIKSEIVAYPKSEEERKQIRNAICKNAFLFNVLKDDQLEKIIDIFHPAEIPPNELIIEEGDLGSHMFVSSTGHYQVIIRGNVFSEFRENTVFGELAILYNDKRLATIKALTTCRVWKIDRRSYQHVLVKNEIEREQEIVAFLKNVPMVKTASEMNLQSVAGLFTTEFFKTDTVIVKQGESGDKFFIVRAGSVTIKKDEEGIVAHLTRGEIFGERALLQSDKLRQATVIADSPGVECLVLSCDHFIDHFGDIANFLKHRESLQRVSIQPVRNKYSQIEMSELKTHTTLGLGGFGRVELVQHIDNPNQVFALKKLKRLEMIKHHQVEHVFNEKNVQFACESRFIVQLYKTYLDKQYLYFLLEVCLGGDLFFLLQRQRTRSFTESSAKFLSACVLEALAHLHERNYVYRDLKPENMLIDAKGYVKLTDFGFAKKLKNQAKTYTFAGTPEYVAPEVVTNRGHDKAVDYWGLGIFIFELLVGKTPFKCPGEANHTNTYKMIVKGIDGIAFPIKVGKLPEDLVRKLCRKVPSERLGCQVNGAQDIRDHGWYTGFNWQLLRDGKLRAPFVPRLSSKVDTRYVDTFPEEQDIPLEDTSDKFEGF